MSIPDVQVEIAFDSGWSTPAEDRTWTDVSDYVELSEGIGIGVGRGDEFATADANTLALTLDNSDGRFTPGLATSPYYPDVKIGRPIRVFGAVASNNNYISNSTFEVNTTGWVPGGFTTPPTLSTSTAQAWQGTKSMLVEWNVPETVPIVQVTVAGLTIGLTYTVSAYVYVPSGSEPVAWVHGASGSFGFVSDKNDEWTRIRLTFVAEATSVPLQLWPQVPPTTGGQTFFVDGAMVNLGAAALSFADAVAAESSRFVGYVTSWPTVWDGTDTYAKAQVTASSRLARLGADAQLRSILEEEYAVDSPVGHFTLGESEGATRAADSTGNLRPLRTTGFGAPIVFGNATGPGTDSLTAATFAGGKYLAGDLETSLVLADGYWLSCWFNTTGTNDGLLSLRIGVAGGFELYIDGSGAIVAVGSAVLTGPVANDGETHHALFAVDSVNKQRLFLDGEEVAVNTGAAISPSYSIDGFTVGQAVSVTETLVGSLAHVAFGTTALTDARITAHYEAGSVGFAGEKPGKRIQRYAGYAAIPLIELDVDTGNPTLSHIDSTGQTPLDLMRKVEQTEGGVLFDAPDGTLTFQHRGRRYTAASQFTIEADEQYLESDYSPQYDDSTLINTVNAKSGDETVTVAATDQTSFDNYGPRNAELELFTTDETEIHAAAWWRVNTYAEPATRVPTLSVDLYAFSDADQASILALTVGSRITVTGLPSQAAASSADYFVEGYAETITPDTYVLTYNVSPAEPYLSTWILDSASRSQLGTTTTLAY